MFDSLLMFSTARIAAVYANISHSSADFKVVHGKCDRKVIVSKVHGIVWESTEQLCSDASKRATEHL